MNGLARTYLGPRRHFAQQACRRRILAALIALNASATPLPDTDTDPCTDSEESPTR